MSAPLDSEYTVGVTGVHYCRLLKVYRHRPTVLMTVATFVRQEVRTLSVLLGSRQ